jgi:hypothetical protein
MASGGMDATVTMLYWSFFAEKTPKLKNCQGRHFFNIILYICIVSIKSYEIMFMGSVLIANLRYTWGRFKTGTL